MLRRQLSDQFDGVILAAGRTEGPDGDVGGRLVRGDPPVDHQVEDLVNRGERIAGALAGLGQQDVVGRPVGREARGRLDHVVEEGDRVVDGGGDRGVGLEEGVVEAGIKRRFRGGDNGAEELLGVRQVRRRERRLQLGRDGR